MATTKGEIPLAIKYSEKIPNMEAFAIFTWPAILAISTGGTEI